MSATCLRDEPGLDGDDLLAVFVDDLRRTYTLGPPPRMGPALAEVLAAGTRTAADRPVALAPQRGAGGLLGRLQGRRPRLALGAAAASLTFLGMGTAGALPGPAQSAFDRSADAVGISLPVTDTRDSTAPDAHDPDELPGTFSSRHQDGDGAGAGQGADPSVPPAGGRQGAVASDGAAATDASSSAGTDRGDVGVPGGDAGGRARQPHVEHPAAEHRPAPGPERGRQPEERGDPRSGVGPEVGTGAEDRRGLGLGRGSAWHRPAWSFTSEEAVRPAAGPGADQEVRDSGEIPAQRAYPSRPSRR